MQLPFFLLQWRGSLSLGRDEGFNKFFGYEVVFFLRSCPLGGIFVMFSMLNIVVFFVGKLCCIIIWGI
jgi:hypothetical protein